MKIECVALKNPVVLYSIRIKVSPKRMLYSIRMKLRLKSTEYIRMNLRPKSKVYSIRMKIVAKSIVYRIRINK